MRNTLLPLLTLMRKKIFNRHDSNVATDVVFRSLQRKVRNRSVGAFGSFIIFPQRDISVLAFLASWRFENFGLALTYAFVFRRIFEIAGVETPR